MTGPARLGMERGFYRREPSGRRALGRQRLAPVSPDEVLDEIGAGGRRDPEQHGCRGRGGSGEATSHRWEHDSSGRVLYSMAEANLTASGERCGSVSPASTRATD